MIYFVSAQQRFPTEGIQCISVKESLRLLEPLRIVGLDTETDSLDCWTGNLLSLQLGCKEFQVVIDCQTIDARLYKEYLESNRLFLGWNLKFDLKWLYRKGIIPKNVYDGFLAEKLMWLGYPTGIHSMGLKAAGENYCGVELDKSIRGQIIWKGMTDEVIVYAATDVKYLEEIREKQLKLLEEKGLLTAIDYENRFVRALAYVEYCGVRLDEERWKEKMAADKEKMNARLADLNHWVEEHYSDDKRFCERDFQGNLFTGFDTSPKCTINWNSSKQVIPLLESEGLDLYTKDKQTGEMKKSIDAKVIKPQKAKSSIVPVYVEYREAQKVVSTYGDNFLAQVNPASHRIHTNYQQLGADTTRITSGGKDKGNGVEYVNLLNLPADAQTRACFVAEPGNRWISIDYSGQETYLLASIANDQAIIKELMEGSGDIHSLTAYMAYQQIPRDTPIKDIKKKYHNLRQEAKGIEFAINYGGDANTIATNKGIPIQEAQKIYNDYMSGFKGVKKYQDFCRKDVMQKGYILLNPLTGHKAYIYDYEELMKDKASFSEPGFWDAYRELKRTNPQHPIVQKVRHFFKRKSASEKQSINYRIQGTGSMCLRVTLVNFFNWIVENNLFDVVKITIPPYDEVNCEAPAEIAEEVALKLHEIMKKAGAYFCTRCVLDADISYNEDGSLPDHWVH